MRRKTYSKCSGDRNGESTASAMFDMVSSPCKNSVPNEGIEKPWKLRTRAQSKKTKEIPSESEKMLSVINEKEDASNDNDSSDFMIFKEDLKKKKGKYRPCARNRKPSKRTTRSKRNYTEKEKLDENDEESEVNIDLFIEEIVHTPHKGMKKIRSKKDKLTRKVVETKSANMKEVKLPVECGDNRNIKSSTQKDCDASIEIARDNIDSSACPFPFTFKQTSPELLIKEPGRNSSEEDSVLAGDGSFSTDYDEIPNQMCQTEESSKYTYTFVSTYTQGTSCQSHSSTTSANCFQVPMKINSHLNSTTCRDKVNISEIEFPISPIHERTETERTPMKKTQQSNGRIARKDQNKYDTTKKKTTHQPPKCSTMLFTSEMTDCDSFFPVSAICIEKVDPFVMPSATKSDCVKETVQVQMDNLSPRISPLPICVKNPILIVDKDHGDNKKTAKRLEKNKANPLMNFGWQEGEGEEIRKNTEVERNETSIGRRTSVANSPQDFQCHQDNYAEIEKTITTSSVVGKMGISLLKNLKRTTPLFTFTGSSAKSKKTSRVTFSNVDEEIHNSNQPVKKASRKYFKDTSSDLDKPYGKCEPHCNIENEASAVENLPLASYKSTVPDMDGKVYPDWRQRLDDVGREDLEMCYISRMCLRYKTLLRDKQKNRENSSQRF